MVKKCGNCGAPAPDSNSRFCDLCGAPFKEEPVTPQGLPVCPSCGAVVSDIKAQFCDACGAPLVKPVCPACGNTAPSAHSKFCTRCGATFTQGGAATKSRIQPRQPAVSMSPDQDAVVVKLKKGRLPVPDEPVEEWDPWTDGDPSYDISAPLPRQSQPQKQYTDLQRVADEMARSQVQRTPLPQPEMVQFSEPKRKYSHLPLIADELRSDLDQRNSGLEQIDAGKKAAPPAKKGKKKGLFG